MIEQVLVAPGHERRGVGHRLLEHAEGYAIAERASALQIVVERDNSPARSFYLRSGYVPIEDELFELVLSAASPMSTYDVVVVHRTGKEHVHRYTTEEPLEPGDVVRLEGRHWLSSASRATARRRSPRAIGCGFAIRTAARTSGRSAASDPTRRGSATRSPPSRTGARSAGRSSTAAGPRRERRAVPRPRRGARLRRRRSDAARPRARAHARPRSEDELPEGAEATLARAADEGLSVELVALEPGEEPDWEAAERFIDALVLEEIEDDLIEQCGSTRTTTRATRGWTS